MATAFGYYLISGQAVSLRPQQEVAVGRKGTKPHNATKMSERKDTFLVLYSPALFLGLKHDDQGVLLLQHFDLWVALQRALEAFDHAAQHNAGIMFMNEGVRWSVISFHLHPASSNMQVIFSHDISHNQGYLDYKG